MLVTAGAHARVVIPWTADHARMQDRLETLEPLDTPTDLAPAVELALSAAADRPGASVAVFTDLPPQESDSRPRISRASTTCWSATPTTTWRSRA